VNASDPFAPRQGGAELPYPAPAPAPAFRPVRAGGGGRAVGIEIAVVAMAAAVIAALGAPLAVVWWLVAPKVPIVVTSSGPVYVNYETERFMSADGWFVTLGAGLGLVVAIVSWLVVRYHRGPAMLAALVVGPVGGALLASWLGAQFGRSDYDYLLRHAPTGSIFYHPIALGAQGGLFVEAVLAVFAYTLIAGCSRYMMLTKHRPDPDAERRRQYREHLEELAESNPLPPVDQPNQPDQTDQTDPFGPPPGPPPSGPQPPTATASFPVVPPNGQQTTAAPAQPDWLTVGPQPAAPPAPEHSGPFQPFAFPRSNPIQPSEQPIDPFAPPQGGPADWPR
jgi:hypothetical protein